MPEPTQRPLHELVAELAERGSELTVAQLFRIVWALKLSTLLTIIGGIIGYTILVFTIGRYTASSDAAAASPEYRLGIDVTAYDDSLPKLADAVFDGRSLDEFAAEISRREAERQKLTDLQHALQQTKSLYADEVGKSFKWSGIVAGFDVVHDAPDGKVIAVTITSGEHTARCLFDEQGNIGRLTAIKQGDRITVTGVLAGGGQLVRCELVDR
jgi:hypothetical protein